MARSDPSGLSRICAHLQIPVLWKLNFWIFPIARWSK
jgi:hypothetical protein